MADRALLTRFRRHYRGAWAAEDALVWLDDPRRRGPSGAPGPAVEVERLRLAVYRRGEDPAAGRLHAAAAERLRADLATAREALGTAHGAARSRAPWLAAAVGAALLAAAAIASAALVREGGPAPAPIRAPSTLQTRFAPPTAPGTRVWSARGVGSLPSSPVLDAGDSPVVVALACRGRGAILVLVDQQERRVTCAAGRVRQDTEYFVGHHGRFTLALSISAAVEWTLTVTAPGAG